MARLLSSAVFLATRVDSPGGSRARRGKMSFKAPTTGKVALVCLRRGGLHIVVDGQVVAARVICVNRSPAGCTQFFCHR